LENSTHQLIWSSVEEIVRAAARDFVQSVLEDEVTLALDRARYERGGDGYRNGHRERSLLTSTGPVELLVPRARLFVEEGEREFRSSVIPKHRRLSCEAESLIAAVYLCGVSTRRVSLALSQALGPSVSKSTVSRCLEQLRPSFEAWQKRDLSNDAIVRLIVDGFGVDVRVDRKSARMNMLVCMGVMEDGQKVVLSIKEMASESKAAWAELLEDLSSRGVKEPQLLVCDGSKGLESAISEIWPKTLVQRCTVHKLRNLLAHAPKSMHEELELDYRQMIYADTAEDALAERERFLVKYRSKCPAVAKSLEEAGDKLFTFLRFPPIQWKGIRTTNAIERLNEEFRRRVKVQGMQPNGQSVCMLFWALIASGAITLRKVDGYETLNTTPTKELNLTAA
jgi:putative transposase